MIERFGRLGYGMQLLVALVAYGVLLVISITLLASGGLEDSLLRFPIALLPVAVMAAIVWIVVQRFRSLDEYWQTVHLTALPFAIVASMGLTLTWGFLENVGAPSLDGFVWFLVINATYVVGLAIAMRRYR